MSQYNDTLRDRDKEGLLYLGSVSIYLTVGTCNFGQVDKDHSLYWEFHDKGLIALFIKISK